MPTFGPEQNQSIDFTGTKVISVPAGQRVLFRFSFEAWWENVIQIYSKQTLQLLAERGNYARSTGDYITDNSGNPEPSEILVTAWHKASPPSADTPWQQTLTCHITQGDNLTIVGFSDTGVDNGYRNAVVSATRLT